MRQAASIAPAPDWMINSRVKGLVAFIIGGASGIGEATARTFAANGAAVLVADRQADEAKRVAQEIVQAGGRAASAELDVSSPDHIEAAVQQLIDKFGQLDMLVNTAAFVKPGMLEDGPMEDWQRSFRVNVEGALRLAKACLPYLKKSAHASIVHVGSHAGIHGFPRGSGYGPSKAALLTLTRQMGLEWAAYGIRVNIVIPGMIDTPMSRGTVSPQVRTAREAVIPMHRVGQPEEVANLIVYLSSPAASYLTAEAYNCDGGLSESMFMASFDSTGTEAAVATDRPADPSLYSGGSKVLPDWMVQSPLRGLAALVVGGGSGIGEATAKIFAANGGAVAVADRNGDAARRVSAEIEAAGGSAIAVEMDLSDLFGIDRTVNKAIGAFGRLDSLVNTAAMVRPQPLEGCSMDDWRACFQVNVDSALLLARACLPHLRHSPAASIVNVGSLGGIWGRPNGGAYGPSKAALMTLSRQLALEWSRYGIRVNAVTPGTIDTPLARATVPVDVLAARAAEIPMGRLGRSEEMADLIVYLMSPAASYVTAQIFNCDGGHAQSMFFVPMGT